MAPPAGFIKDSDTCGALLPGNSTCRVGGHILKTTQGTSSMVYTMVGHDDYGHSATYNSTPMSVTTNPMSTPNVSISSNVSVVTTGYGQNTPSSGIIFNVANNSGNTLSLSSLTLQSTDSLNNPIAPVLAVDSTVGCNSFSAVYNANQALPTINFAANNDIVSTENPLKINANSSCTIYAHLLGNTTGSGYAWINIAVTNIYGTSYNFNSSSSKINWKIFGDVNHPVLYQDNNIAITDIESRNYTNDTLVGINVGYFGLKGYTVYNKVGNGFDFSQLGYLFAGYQLNGSEMTLDMGLNRTTCNIYMGNGLFSGLLATTTNQCNIVFKYYPQAKNESGFFNINRNNSSSNGNTKQLNATGNTILNPQYLSF